MTIVARIALVALALATAALPASAQSRIADPHAFLAGTRWYVPTATLPAALFDPSTGVTSPVLDQTVWVIDDYRYGYFTGRAVVMLKAGSRETTQCMRLVGSVAPTGSVLISFIDRDATTAAGATNGNGRLYQTGARWRFLMQMASGSTALVAHWSWMDQCKSGEACEGRLPGTTQSLAAFLARCP
jgi:hypothetical protein